MCTSRAWPPHAGHRSLQQLRPSRRPWTMQQVLLWSRAMAPSTLSSEGRGAKRTSQDQGGGEIQACQGLGSSICQPKPMSMICGKSVCKRCNEVCWQCIIAVYANRGHWLQEAKPFRNCASDCAGAEISSADLICCSSAYTGMSFVVWLPVTVASRRLLVPVHCISQ